MTTSQEHLDRMDHRLTALEASFREQEAVCEKTKQTTDRIFYLLQGDPELESDGFIRRQSKAMNAIAERLESIESDKTESRNHRAKTVDLPERVLLIERALEAQHIRRGTVIWVLSGIVTIAGTVGGFVSWVLSLL